MYPFDTERGVKAGLIAVAILLLILATLIKFAPEPTADEIEAIRLKESTRVNVGGHIMYKKKIGTHYYWYNTSETTITHDPDCPCNNKN
ncbi:MAG: hypothetical protein IKO46_05990 [Salinivirgaceae bacterium]|nr:hypothetical protein [Salinivirgaceae bacterium]